MGEPKFLDLDVAFQRTGLTKFHSQKTELFAKKCQRIRTKDKKNRKKFMPDDQTDQILD